MSVLLNEQQAENTFSNPNPPLSYMHTMTHSISIIGITILGTVLSIQANATPIMKNIPDSEQSRKFHNDPFLQKLRILLEQGELEKFYETVKPIIDKRELPTSAGTLSGDELDKQLLIDRYIISAPLFELKANTAIHKDYFLGSDIKLKEKVMDDLYVISKTNLEQNRPPSQKKETARLCSIYAATVVRMLRDYYRPNIEEENRNYQKNREAAWQTAFTDKWGKFIKEDELYEKNWKQPESEEEKARDREMEEKRKAYEKAVREKCDQQREMANKMVISENRNSSIEWYFKRREGTLVNILLLNYPGKSTEIFNHLKMAGYEEKEMMPLVDRTIGRNKKTEFLYQSNLGRKFLKEQEKESHQN